MAQVGSKIPISELRVVFSIFNPGHATLRYKSPHGGWYTVCNDDEDYCTLRKAKILMGVDKYYELKVKRSGGHTV